MKEIFVYRLVGAARIRWKFVVDEHDNLIHEGPSFDISSPPPVKPPSAEEIKFARKNALSKANAKTAMNANIEIFKKRGIEYKELGDGRLQIISIPQKERKISQFLKLDDSQCPDEIPNCNGLKTRMLKEIEGAGGDKCPGCELNRIKNKYRDIVTPLVEASLKDE